MQHDYDIIIKANISIGGRYTAESREEAVIAAQHELRSGGEISDMEVERAVMLDEEER